MTDWTPVGEQTIHAWRKYSHPEEGVVVVDEPVEITDEMRERVMEAVAENFGACSNVTAEQIIRAVFPRKEQD